MRVEWASDDRHSIQTAVR